ncbi:MAG: hypothetical protein ACM3U2_10635, partial [Deltaproteobacteria bacterium]
SGSHARQSVGDEAVFDAFPRSGERGYNLTFIFDKALVEEFVFNHERLQPLQSHDIVVPRVERPLTRIIHAAVAEFVRIRCPDYRWSQNSHEFYYGALPHFVGV